MTVTIQRLTDGEYETEARVEDGQLVDATPAAETLLAGQDLEDEQELVLTYNGPRWIATKTDADPSSDPDEEDRNPPVDQSRKIRQAWQTVRQANDDPSVPLDEDGEMPPGVQAVFNGPSGAVAAEDEIHEAYADLDPATIEQVNEEIVDSLTQPQGWSSRSIQERITPLLVNAGLDRAEAKQRADTISRMEPRSMASEWKMRLWQQEEADRGQEFDYTIRGADDFRTTKMSRWQREQVPDGGAPLEDIKDILDKSIEKAKNGDFTEQGKNSDIPGDPIKLDSGFQRRGFISHYGDRDRVVRVT